MLGISKFSSLLDVGAEDEGEPIVSRASISAIVTVSTPKGGRTKGGGRVEG